MPQKQSASIILASASPRRRQLLAEAGYKFTVVQPDIDESAFPAKAIKACEYAKQLALAKANSIAQKYPDSLVIGADTIVDYQGQIIGKPADAKDARQITKKLFSTPHKVITGIAIVRLRDNIELVESDTTTVFPKKMTAEQIAEHIKGEGSLTNVMGLPMELVKSLLAELKISFESKENI
jgi:septum formation protein